MFKRLMAVLMVGAAVLVAAPTAASAATNPGCGSACDGRDPSFTYFDANETPHKCQNDAVTIYSSTPQVGVTYQLRYSRACRTAWARTTSTLISGFGLRIVSYNSNGTQRRIYEVDSSVSAYTPMVNDAGLTAAACIHVPVSPPDYWGCTARY